MENIKITLESLYDILRNEKKREDLQNLNESFYADIVAYLQEKRNLLKSKESCDDLFASGEKDKLEYELRSIKRILKEIYEKREKKIMDIALNRSRTRSDIIDTSAMLKEEKEYYQELLEVLDFYRKGIILNLFNGKLPELDKNPEKKELKTKLILPEEEKIPVETKKEEIISKKTFGNLTKVKFVHPTPSFVWKDFKEYGPFDIGEEIEIYPEVAELLVRKGRAEKV